MHAPKEAEKDLLFMVIACAVILALISGLVVRVSGFGGLTYLRLSQDQTVAVGKIVEVVDWQVTYSYVGPDKVVRSKVMAINRRDQGSFRPGTAIRVLYNRNHPEYFIADQRLGGLAISFYILVGVLAATLISLLASCYAWHRYYQLKKRTEYY